MIAADTSRQPVDLILLLALCPLLAVSDTVVKGLALGLATVFVLFFASAILALLARWIDAEIRLAATLLIVASVIATAELLLRAWFYEAWIQLGIFLPVLAANAAFVVLMHDADGGRARLVIRAVKLSLTIAGTLFILGIARELVGRGSLLHDAGAVFGAWASGFEMNVFRVDMGFLLAMLPPGAFIALGLLIALRNWIVRRVGFADEQ